ncbi:dihydrolipoyl dehydrogenase [Pseudomonas sp. RP23018S]|uniref:dihydrolipoyl dehydrogenase n=1 Tax=Pseudomonas sp. RP23018S TaxID=3096037 RepID=UPI002ACA0088|nr:dihydrolipoyl dehydrogenase [Pseudomonas sp. RP23018S]MDZ5601867.1 dihydrolipoyl dehydrogenase [Pseudomonas sp. RP23018S]
MNEAFDVLIIGGGPGGYVAAIRAAQLGLRTALVEKQHLGGICLNWGCIPTKAMLRGAEVAHTLQQAGTFGFSVGQVEFDIGTLVAHSREVSQTLTGGIAYLLKKNGITVFDGRARLTAKGCVSVTSAEGERALQAKHIILATGARPRPLPAIVPDGERIWSYFEALVPQQVPASLLVVGSGAIGVEFASLYHDLGCAVTLVEVAGQILPAEDREVASLVQREFERRGIRVLTQASVSAVRSDAEQAQCSVRLADGREEQIGVERVLLAAGIQANSEDLGLEALGVEIERGFIKTDPWCRTNVAGLYAIGDVAGAPCLAHKASHEGVLCVEKLAGVEGVHPLDKAFIPGCTYARPQVASLGLTEAAAKASGRRLNIGRFDYQANGKALAMGEAGGFVKTIFDADSGELLGAHMVGPEVTEQIQGLGIAQALEATEQSLSQVVFAHPTLSEAMHEAVLAASGKALHQ